MADPDADVQMTGAQPIPNPQNTTANPPVTPAKVRQNCTKCTARAQWCIDNGCTTCHGLGCPADDCTTHNSQKNYEFILQPAPHRGEGVTTIPQTPFAPVYRSILTLQLDSDPALLTALKHVNCSYLSTPGLAPTLTELKAHAQSLVILIKQLTISTRPAIIDNANTDTGEKNRAEFVDGETYDFLNDLSKPYRGPENAALARHHNMPLTALLNTIEQFTINTGCGKRDTITIKQMCPLHPWYVPQNAVRPPGAPGLPYENIQTLIEHANECLELLDQEYKAKGGLLALVPTCKEEGGNEEREKAKSTLLGQLIIWVQKLVNRVHDLEREHAAAVDTLAGEAIVPSELLGTLGPTGRTGRELVYPQDRFVLSNCGEDLWQWLNLEFARKERIDEEIMEGYLRAGATGRALWEKKYGKEISKGITMLDINTRYYRVRNGKGGGRSIFIVPAFDKHPGTKVTRELEKKPSVVAVVKPVWPERASAWELRHQRKLENYKKQDEEYRLARDELEEDRQSIKLLERELDTVTKDRDLLRDLIDDTENVRANELQEKLRQAQEARRVNENNREQAEKYKKTAREEKEQAQNERLQLQKERAELAAKIKAFDEASLAQHQEESAKFKGIDLQAGQLGTKVEKLLREKWIEALARTEALSEALRAHLVDVASVQVSDEALEKAKKCAEKTVDDTLRRTAEGGRKLTYDQLEEEEQRGLRAQSDDEMYSWGSDSDMD